MAPYSTLSHSTRAYTHSRPVPPSPHHQKEVFSFPDVAICLSRYQGCVASNLADCVATSDFQMLSQYVSAGSTRVRRGGEERKNPPRIVRPPRTLVVQIATSLFVRPSTPVHIFHLLSLRLCLAFWCLEVALGGPADSDLWRMFVGFRGEVCRTEALGRP